MRYNHILTIGTTGMLLKTSYQLALQTNTLTSIARTERSLKRLEGGLDPHGPTFFPIQADYSDTTHFMREVERSSKRGPFDLVVAWVHDSGTNSLTKLLGSLAKQEHKTDFYHILGSSAADPEQKAKMFEAPSGPGLYYHQVILGFKIQENGRSRWLHHGEINSGVLQAIRTGHEQTIIGSVEPWSQRP